MQEFIISVEDVSETYIDETKTIVKLLFCGLPGKPIVLTAVGSTDDVETVYNRREYYKNRLFKNIQNNTDWERPV